MLEDLSNAVALSIARSTFALLTLRSRCAAGTLLLLLSAAAWSCRDSDRAQAHADTKVAAPPTRAEDGAMVLVGNRPTGVQRFANGLLMRTSPQTCPSLLPRDTECRSTRGSCQSDAQCAGEANGYCSDLGDGQGCHCRSGCREDTECGQGALCLCADPIGICVVTTCPREGCPAPEKCATYHDGCIYRPFACIEKAVPPTCNY